MVVQIHDGNRRYAREDASLGLLSVIEHAALFMIRSSTAAGLCKPRGLAFLANQMLSGVRCVKRNLHRGALYCASEV